MTWDRMSRYRSCVYYDGGEGGVFFVDCDAMNVEEADRIGIHHFLKSDRAKHSVKRVESLQFFRQPEE